MPKPAWKQQEARIAKVTGGTLNAGSGAFSRKGDIRADDLHIEAKFTGKKTFTVKADVLEECFREALVEDRIPVTAIEMNGRNYWIVEEADGLEWYRAWKAAR